MSCRPEDDRDHQRRESFFYNTLEDLERRGLVLRTIRPPSGPSGQPATPLRELHVSDWERKQAMTLYRGHWLGYDLPPDRARDWRWWHQDAGSGFPPLGIAKSEMEAFEAIDRTLDGEEPNETDSNHGGYIQNIHGDQLRERSRSIRSPHGAI